MVIHIDNYQELDARAQALRSGAAEAVAQGALAVSGVAKEIAESQQSADMAITEAKLDSTAQVDLENLSGAIEAFSSTLQAIKGNYQQAQVRAIERIMKV